jgi:hypothetical protein
LTASYPELTPYQFASNSPILNIDIDGLEAGNSMAYLWNEVGKVKQELKNAYDNTVKTLENAGSAMKTSLWDSWSMPNLEGTDKPTSGIQYWSKSGPTVEDKKSEPASNATIKSADVELLGGLGKANSARKIMTKTDKSSGDGKGSGNTGGTDWSKPKDVTKTLYEGAQKVTGNDPYKMAKDANQNPTVKPVENNQTGSRNSNNSTGSSNISYEGSPQGEYFAIIENGVKTVIRENGKEYSP